MKKKSKTMPKGGMRGGGKTKMGTKMRAMGPGMKPGGATNDKLEMVAKGDKMVPKFVVDGKGPNDELGKKAGGVVGPIKTMKKMYKGGMTTKTKPKGGGSFMGGRVTIPDVDATPSGGGTPVPYSPPKPGGKRGGRGRGGRRRGGRG